MGLAIEVWKLRKAIKSVSIGRHDGAMLPSLRIVPADSYAFSETKLYDDEAMTYLSHALYPVVVGYALYSLAYQDHKSWYSWLLGSTVNFVYSFGFVLMTPQRACAHPSQPSKPRPTLIPPTPASPSRLDRPCLS